MRDVKNSAVLGPLIRLLTSLTSWWKCGVAVPLHFVYTSQRSGCVKNSPFFVSFFFSCSYDCHSGLIKKVRVSVA